MVHTLRGKRATDFRARERLMRERLGAEEGAWPRVTPSRFPASSRAECSACISHSPAPAHLANEEIQLAKGKYLALRLATPSCFSLESNQARRAPGFTLNRSPPPPSAVPGSPCPERAGTGSGPPRWEPAPS